MSLQKRIIPLVIILLVLMAIGIIGLFGGWNGILKKAAEPAAPVSVAANTVDPQNNERMVSVQGTLVFEQPAVDDELGVSDPDAVVLLRHVEMYQWLESCIAGACTQSPDWSSQRVDAMQFREQLGHTNPDHFPFESKTFLARGVRLGAFSPDMNLVTAEVPMLPKVVRLGELPANLAASFSEFDGWIYAGNDPLNPVVGDLRINYRMVSAGTATLNGWQAGDRLLAKPAE